MCQLYLNLLYLTVLKIPNNVYGQSWFNFVVNASGDVNFSGSHQVQTVTKTHSLFIQTDKYLYKPGQKGLFNDIKLMTLSTFIRESLLVLPRRTNYNNISYESHCIPKIGIQLVLT